ncbi:MAG: ABC transporter permease [Actinomycetota bacterium]|nr:ABC transporter permease [Actinomycetota bacterium]
MKDSLILGGRAAREALRTPDSLFPSVFIPLFFLVVNVGQTARIFPTDSTDFLRGQSYAAFQLPSSLLLSASFGAAALYLVEEIEGGYFDKLRATPIPRMAIIGGRLWAELIKTAVLAAVMVAVSLPFGIRIESGVLGFLLLIVMVAMWGVVFAGFMQLIAIKTRSAAATQGASLVFFPLLFLTPNFVPRNLLTRPMEIAATLNPVTYIMEAVRTLVLDGFEWTALGRGFLVIAVTGAIMLALSVRLVNNYD